MADGTTTNRGLVKPEVGASADTWGTKLNTDLDTIDSFIGDASTTAKGVVELATPAETQAGTDAGRAVTPAGLGAVICGMVAQFGTTSAPTGWLKCNGAAVSRTTYAALFTAIGTTFGIGDGSTTFNVPELRGEFVRGLDDSRGVDAGRLVGTAQSSQNLAHTHDTVIERGSETAPGVNPYGLTYTSNTGNRTVTSTSSGGTEARPRNVALLYCIKY